MPLTYEDCGLTLINPSYKPTDVKAEQWGIIENTRIVSTNDWIGADCLSTSYVATGHKHAKVYNEYGLKSFDSNNTIGLVTIGICDDGYATGVEVENQQVDIVIGSVASRFRVKTNEDVVLLDIVPGDNDLLINPDGSCDINITPKSASPTGLTIDSGNYRFLTADTYGYSVKIGESNLGSAPTVFIGSNLATTVINTIAPVNFEGSTGKVYTKDAINMAHNIVGTSSINAEGIMMSSLGRFLTMQIYIDGVRDSSADFHVVVPFSNGFAPTADCSVGQLTGVDYGTPATFKVIWENDDVEGQGKLHIRNLDGSEITADQAFNVSGILNFVVTDPAFVNAVT